MKFIRCEICKAKIPQEKCELAVHHRVIDGKEYTFCCEKCAQQYLRKTKQKS